MKTAIQEEGFTFTELLVAITILALVSIPVLSMLLNGYSYTVMAGRQTVANLCRDKIEDFKAKGYSGCINLFKNSAGLIRESQRRGPLPEGYELYRRETV